MPITIRTVVQDDIVAIQNFTEQAFEQIFASFKAILGDAIFERVFPDWRALQRGHVTTFYDDPEAISLVALVGDVPAGLIVYRANAETKIGVVDFLVVHPEYQGQGIGAQLNEHVFEKLREAGMAVVEVSTGGDESHAPARRLYEKVGYVGIPNVVYYKNLLHD